MFVVLIRGQKLFSYIVIFTFCVMNMLLLDSGIHSLRKE